jgi:hypothetical protein
MTRRLGLCLLAVLLLANPLLAKRRAVTPGTERCVVGRVAILAYTTLLTADAQHIYWLDDFGYLLRVPRLGGEVEELALFEEYLPLAMVVDATHVYISALPLEAIFRPTPGMILSVPKGGGVPGVLISGVASPFELEADATHLYWAAAGTLDFEGGTVAPDGKIERALKNGTGRQVLADNVSAPVDVALEGNLVWFGQTGLADGNETIGLYTVPKVGGTVSTITDDVIPAEIALSPTTVFVYGASEAADNALFAVARDGSSVRELIAGETISGGLQAVDGRLYYVTEDEEAHSIRWIAASGGTPTLVRDDLYYTNDYVIDGCAIIMGTAEGELVRTAR